MKWGKMCFLHFIELFCIGFLRMYQCADAFTAHHLLQVAYGIHVEHDDRKLVFFAHASSG